jgi:hypothetical protein
MVIIYTKKKKGKKRKKNHVNKNQGWEPIHHKYKANENTSRHNPKKKKLRIKILLKQQ